VAILDARKFDGPPLAYFEVSKKAVSSVSMSPGVPGLLATTSLDGKVSVFDVQTILENGSVNLITTKNPKFVHCYSILG
jgi:periodic tryptophan protein 1